MVTTKQLLIYRGKRKIKIKKNKENNRQEYTII